MPITGAIMCSIDMETLFGSLCGEFCVKWKVDKLSMQCEES